MCILDQMPINGKTLATKRTQSGVMFLW
jgi:hypothetical protein